MRHRSTLGASVAILTLTATGITPILAQSPSAAPVEPSAAPAGSMAPGGSAAPMASEAPLGGADISGSISIFGQGYETGDEIAKTRVDHFKELYPDVQLTFSEGGWDEQQFITAIGSSTPPDVVNIPRNVMGTYVAKNVLTPLDDCISQAGIDMSVYQDAAVQQVTVDGTVYGLPQFFNTRLWIVNTKAFEDAGLDPQTFDWSDWDAIAGANEQMTKNDNGQLSRIGIDPKLPEFLPLWAKANGVDILSEDGRTSNLEDPRIAEALTFAASLFEPAGGQAPFLDFRNTWDFFGASNQVAADQVGAWPMEQWYINVLADNSPDAPFIVKPFMTKDGQPITWADGDALAIVNGSQNAAAACEFAHVMTAAETWVKAAQVRADSRAAEGKPNTGVYTANKNADAVIFSQIVDLSAMPAFDAAVKTVLDTQQYAFSLPASPAGAEFEQAWRAAIDAVVSGGEDAAQALSDADAEAQSALDAAAQ